MTPLFVYDLSIEDWFELISDWGEQKFRVDQIWRGLYKNLWQNPNDFTTLPRTLQNRVESAFNFSQLRPEIELTSNTGETHKTLFRLTDGNAIETVLMRYKKRRTVCVSTQAGCPLGCAFCATGHMDFRRNLTSGEIIEQVLFYSRRLAVQDEVLTNVVFMGMGEPFLNYESVMATINRLNRPDGFNMGKRRFTISTVGIAPMIRRFSFEEDQVNLAVSLHAADNNLRNTLIPINKKYNLETLLFECREYVRKTRRRITFEWAMIKDVNDSLHQAELLVRRLEGLLCHVNLIPLNSTEKYSGKKSLKGRSEEFLNKLRKYGVPATLRVDRGLDIQAGCGQLISNSINPHK